MLKPIALSIFLLLAVSASAADAPLKVVMFSGSAEYKSSDSLQAFKKLLEEKHNCKCIVNIVEEKGTELNGIDALETADVALFFTRRVKLSDDQLAKVRKFIASGKGVVGVRTASHGFQTWLEFDPQVLGGSYNMHYNKDENSQVTVNEQARKHPVLTGVGPLVTEGKLYKNPKLADDATLLLSAKNSTNTEPVAWVRDARPGVRGRVFYTSLGVPKDFENPDFQTLLANAVKWTAAK